MAAYYDKRETQHPHKREKAQFKALRHILTAAKGRASGLRRQLRGIDIDRLKHPDALAKIPVLRKGDLGARQLAQKPFAGLTAEKPGRLARLLMSPGPIFDPEGAGDDWWGAARALHAAGFRRGDIALNTFSYHFTPGGFIMDSGCRTLGCAVIPAGPGNTDQQLEAISGFQPNAYLGTPDFLKILLDKAAESGRDVSCLTKGVVSGAAFPASLKKELTDRGILAFQAYASADLGVIAYETDAFQGMVVNEDLIVEIVRPGTQEPLAAGEVGEVVVTRLNPIYPLLRFGTGDLSKILPGQSPCGRTNQRLAGWLGRADQTTKVKGMFVHPSQIADVARRHPELGRLRLVVTRENEQDMMTLRAEATTAAASIDGVGETLALVTKLRGKVEIVPSGSLPNDGKVIADERPIG
jgi:phenylacetate-CoA ligase